MPISFKKGQAVLRGALDIEEAERLLSALEKDKERQLDLSELESIHTAVLQVLMAKRPSCKVPPNDPDLAALLQPHLGGPAPEPENPASKES